VLNRQIDCQSKCKQRDNGKSTKTNRIKFWQKRQGPIGSDISNANPVHWVIVLLIVVQKFTVVASNEAFPIENDADKDGFIIAATSISVCANLTFCQNTRFSPTQSSSGRKIAMIPPISTIYGRNYRVDTIYHFWNFRTSLSSSSSSSSLSPSLSSSPWMRSRSYKNVRTVREQPLENG